MMEQGWLCLASEVALATWRFIEKLRRSFMDFHVLKSQSYEERAITPFYLSA